MHINFQSVDTLLFAIMGGMVPIFLWLWFWLREDKLQPEPKTLLFLTFLGGMIGTAAALSLESFASTPNIVSIFVSGPLSHIGTFLGGFVTAENPLKKILMVVIFSPIIEELIKFFAGYFIAMRSKANDEPIDPIIYMITAALGFAAVENILYLLIVITDPNSTQIFTLLTGDARFMGATVLHTVSSAVIGMFIGFSYFETKKERFFYTILGIVLAILLHSAFNFSIILGRDAAAIAMECFWVAVVIILLLFERIKNIKLNKI